MTMTKWNLENRKSLKFLLSEGFNLKMISNNMHVAYPTLIKELKRGLTVKEFRERRYTKYSISLAIESHIAETLGRDSCDFLHESWSGNGK